MAIYLLLIICLLLSVRNKSYGAFWAYVVLLFIIGACRNYSVGTDTINYLDYFEDAYTSFDMDIRVEPLFQLLTITIKKLGGDYRCFLLIEMFLFLFPISFVIKKTCRYPICGLLLLFLLGYYLSSFNISRQMIAVSFSFLSYYYIEKKEWIKSLIWLLVAFFFHISSIIVIAVIPLLFVDFNKKVINVLIVTSFLLSYMYDLSNMSSRVLSLFPFLGQYQYYTEVMAFEGSRGLQTFSILTNALYLYLYNKRDHQWDMFFKIAIFGLIFSNLMVFAPAYLSRLFVYFDIAAIPFFASRKLKTDRLIVISYSILYFCYYTLYFGIDGVVPYKFM